MRSMQRVLIVLGVCAAAAVGLFIASAVLSAYVLETWNLVSALGGWGIALAVGWPLLMLLIVASRD